MFRGFWYTYIGFDAKYRTVVVASIQMLLAQRILDVTYFLHYYYYGHLLSIIITYNPEETCQTWATSEHDYKQQHWIEMLALLRQNTIIPLSGLLNRLRRYYNFCLNIRCLAIEKRVKQIFSTWILLPVITKLVQPYFQLLVDKGLI